MPRRCETVAAWRTWTEIRLERRDRAGRGRRACLTRRDVKKNTEALVILRFGAYQPLYSRPSLGCLNFINTLICNYAPVQAQMYKVLAFRMTSKHLHDCLNSGWPTITRWTGQKNSTIWPTSWRCKTFETNPCAVRVCPNFRNPPHIFIQIHQNPSNSSKIHPFHSNFNQIHPNWGWISLSIQISERPGCWSRQATGLWRFAWTIQVRFFSGQNSWIR